MIKKYKTGFLAVTALVLLLSACGTAGNSQQGGSSNAPAANNPGSSGGTASNASSGGAAPGASSDQKKNVTVLHVAQNVIPNPPYSYQNDKKVMEGYTVDYLKLLDERLEEYEFQYDQISRDAMLVGVETGKYDFAANFYYRNPEREAKYLFGQQAYGYSINALIVKSNRSDIKSLDDMQGKTLTPMNPALGLKIIVDDYNEKHKDKPIKVDNVDKVTDAESLKWVDQGKYDAFLTNKNTFDTVNAELKLDLKAATYVTKEPIWVLFNKDKANLAKRFDEVTKQLIDDGTLPKLSEKWFGANLFQSLDQVNATYQFK
ncbi:transporter substrate-binding domain-containing protein [Paenibacillus thalictri]|uniref:Transporter substrate-binding domain-containing protein n=1 Tax=Paenibacillus thalictri TaxID=2527873 RepID=A0A4Q9DFX0_9BACL|nr:transporter substrate-binding domain-containing protein [Paenibacillus thalictri]TBL70909.1 transporter substrate-binding domain-containing protein [Paenibacillus thalictri]